MKIPFRMRAIALALCLAMVIGFFPGPITAFSVGTDSYTASVLGAVGVIGAESVLLATAPAGESGHEVMSPVNPAELPEKVVVVDISEGEGNTWYKLDAAPGYTWPAAYDAYRWTYAYAVDITNPNGTTGIFDANGNVVTSLTMPMYNKIKLNADSSLVGTVKYQWQICYDVENDLWANIYNENDKDLTVSLGLLAMVLDGDKAYVRCVTTSGAKVAKSDPVAVTVDFTVPGRPSAPDATVPTESQGYVNITVDGEETTETTIEFDDYNSNNQPIENGAKVLGVNTSLEGELSYSWQARTGGTADGEWIELGTGSTFELSRYALYTHYAPADVGRIAFMRVVVTCGETVIESNELVITINERNDDLYYGTLIENDVTTSSGETVTVSVSGNVPETATLSLADASATTTIPDVDASDIALALDVTIKQDGAEWQPAAGETVAVSIPVEQLGLQNGDCFAVYHIHDGKTEILGPFRCEDGYATFVIDGFSVVAISTNYGAAIGGVAEFAGSSVILDVSPVSFGGKTVWVEDANLPAKVVIKNYLFDEYLGKLFYEIDAAPGYTWPEDYSDLHWCYSDALTNIDIGGSMGVFDENGEPVSFVELPLSAKPTYSVQTSLTGGVKYQWQVCYDVQNYLWMDIDGQINDSITLSYALLAGILDENGMCAVRCMVSNAVKTQEGYPVVIAFTADSTEEPDAPVDEYTATITVDGVETDAADLADRYDAWDESIGEYVPVEGGSLNLSVNTNLTGDDVTYQWQGLSGSEWVKLSTDKDFELTFSDLMFAGTYSGSTAYIRMVVTKGETVVESEQLTITIVGTETAQYALDSGERVNSSSSSSSDGEADTTAEEGNDTSTVLVTVQFVMGNNTVPIENGLFTYNVPYNGTVTDTFAIPVVQGYSAYLEDDRTTVYVGNYTLNEKNITENKVITFRFWPAEVSYKVVYMQQNVSDDGYTVVRTDELTGLTGSDPVVENLVYDGFVQVWCDTDKIASDGSTVIEVKYDRLYYKMLFDLDGGYGVQPVYARYGTPVTVVNPTKAGYSFIGWNALNGPYNASDDEQTADIGAFTGIKIPAEHTNYKAIWRASDAAKVTVVVWGQKADDSDDLTDPNSYAYMSETEDGTDLTNLHFNAKPGTSVTYNPTTGGYICGYTEEHVHGEGDCEATCGKTEHTHSAVGGSCYALKYEHAEHTHSDSCYACGQSSHAHDQTCYDSDPTKIGSAFSISWTEHGISGTQTNGYITQSYTIGFGGTSGTGVKYVYYNGTWYRYTGSAAIGTTLTFACGKTENSHTHSDACGYKCGGEHTHTDDCYERTCGTEEHIHDASCYAGCTKEEHTHGSDCSLTIPMDSDLWEFDHASAVTVAADGTSTLNVYYKRKTFTITFHYNRSGSNYQSTSTITDVWGADIGTRFLAVNTAASGNLWSEDSGGGSPWTSYLQIMPKRNIDYYCRYTSTNEQSAEYYTQKLDGTYELKYTVTAYYDNTLTISKEDFYEMEGFTYSHGKDGDGDSMPSPSSYGDFDGAKFYYTRNDYNLVFDNYNTTFKNESVLYEAPLSGYDPEEDDEYKVPDSLAPAYYQPGSVTFAGWYAAPQTPGDFNFDAVEPFDFANSTMPASDLILYAWWKPVSHQVTFYYNYAAFEANEIYTVDGAEQTFPVPHGSKVQDPYTPPKDPTSNYYSFVGWAYRDANGTEVLWDFENSTVTEDVKLYGKWNSTTPADYEVRFVTVINGKEVEIADPITGSALGGTLKTFDAKFNEELYPGYQDRYYPRDMSHSITINLEDLTQNTFTFYYDYVEYTSYTVKYLEKETGKPMSEIDSAFPVQKTIENNTHAMVTETFVAIPGYLPDAYQKVCRIDPDGTNEIIFYYTKDEVNGLWTVHYWLENLDGTYTEAVDRLFTGTAKIGSTVSAPTDTVIQNYYYYAAHTKNVSSGVISSSEVAHLHMYYNRNRHSYNVQYLEVGTEKVLAPEKNVSDVKWENLVTENALEIANYTVYGASEQSITISSSEDKNVITFYYTENTATLYYVPLTGGKVNLEAETLPVLTGKATGSTATANAGYTFVGWYSDESCAAAYFLTDKVTYIPQKNEGVAWENGKTFYAKFVENEVTINYVAVGPEGATGFGSVSPTSQTVPVITGNPSSTATVGSGTYKFVGWYSDAACKNLLSREATYQPQKVDGLHVAATYYAKFEYNLTSLTIKKAGWKDVDPNQTYLFHVVNKDDPTDSQYVTVHGNGSVTINGLTVGQEYTITEVTEWSWRYSVKGWEYMGSTGNTKSATITLGLNGTITFTNERSIFQWLDGDSWCDNWFGTNDDTTN